MESSRKKFSPKGGGESGRKEKSGGLLDYWGGVVSSPLKRGGKKSAKKTFGFGRGAQNEVGKGRGISLFGGGKKKRRWRDKLVTEKGGAPCGLTDNILKTTRV